MLRGEALYEDMEGVCVAATPFELGVELIEKMYLLCLDKGTSVDLNNLYFTPLKTVYVEPPFHYIKVIFHYIMKLKNNSNRNEKMEFNQRENECFLCRYFWMKLCSWFHQVLKLKITPKTFLHVAEVFQITVQAVLMAMQITEMDEYRREVSEVRNTKDTISNARLTDLSSADQRSTLTKYRFKQSFKAIVELVSQPFAPIAHP